MEHSTRECLEQSIREWLMRSIAWICANINMYVDYPGKDFTRNRKITPFDLIHFLLCKRVKTMRNEMQEWFRHSVTMPTESAMTQARKKLHSKAFYDLLIHFNLSLMGGVPQLAGGKEKIQILAVDGTHVSFRAPKDEKTRKAYSKWIAESGDEVNAACQVTCLYDVRTEQILDCVIQPEHQKDERTAFLELVDRYEPPAGVMAVFVCDRGFASWEVIWHLAKSGHCFVLRTKDAAVKGSQLWPLSKEEDEAFDRCHTVEITRTAQPNSVKRKHPKHPRIILSRNQKFSGLDPDTGGTCELSFRAVRLQLPNGQYETLATNLPQMPFFAKGLSIIYNKRWKIETNFGLLKGCIGAENIVARLPELAEQEILANIVTHNFVSVITTLADDGLEQNRKHIYKTNFSNAANACIDCIKNGRDASQGSLIELVRQSLHTYVPGRSKPRKGNHKAHVPSKCKRAS